ncbi:hypothetical protein L226DRAFT_171196 [Lentinus tigrinus ALCF2SS1-7]|uniref:uncharacterized protein n=1 Tax=Lentinus tigrinus ALCF2SS1-7 TaxID=1328758 RepID=UPI0011661D2E|nr:hypothetical protein L226DRAFT_171196 [Lentinus tigrinus ALCF2SS1-7]
MDTGGLRERPKPLTPGARTVRIDLPASPRRGLWTQQADRILRFQRRWKRIKADLPPQLSRKHIGMISIGGVIGTGLFVGSANALRNGGPIGALLGYIIVGSVVYCLCVSVGEMIAFLPDVGGVVGLADLYVDPALGFSLGWAAWYNWSVTLPTEISAAVIVIGFWDQHHQVPVAAVSMLFLLAAVVVNCFPSRVYGEVEFTLSCVKVLTIVIIILLSLLIDLGASEQGPIGFRNWINMPFAEEYLGISGVKGRFLGFWAVIMQASFSFFGSDVPGIASVEVIDATRNVPRALRKVWMRITLFYVGGVLVSGLLVPATDPGLALNDGTGNSSPFVIAFKLAGWGVVPHVCNAAILVSAWSAAASDIYIASRFLFFLARRGHAPAWLAHLYKSRSLRPAQGRGDSDNSTSTDQSGSEDDSDAESEDSHDSEQDDAGLRERELLGGQVTPAKKEIYVIPLASVLVTSSVGFLTLLSFGDVGANVVFQWLGNVASVASLQQWTATLFTYIRWHRGTVHYERKHQDQDTEVARKAKAEIAIIKKNRQWGQPYLAWYAFVLIAEVLGEDPPSYGVDKRIFNPVPAFLSAYIPLPFFLLLTFGYKLIKQTETIPLDKMTFARGRIPPCEPIPEEPRGRIERLLEWLTII